jgi:hypothetical protein
VLDVQDDKKEDDWWIGNQKRQLHIRKRANIGPRVDFTSDEYFDCLDDICEY